ncbi:MAG: hypothetical protein ABSH38_01980 [Verrucomicrobiota bacterium]|jgi:hypothetical protein
MKEEVRSDLSIVVEIFLFLARFGTIWHDSARFGTIRHDSARFGTIRHDSARFGAIRHDSARFGAIGHAAVVNDAIAGGLERLLRRANRSGPRRLHFMSKSERSHAGNMTQFDVFASYSVCYCSGKRGTA